MPTYDEITKPEAPTYGEIVKPSGTVVTDIDYAFQDNQLFTFQDAVQYIFSTSAVTMYQELSKPLAPVYQEIVRPT